jgi:hypothetical protein
MKRNATCILWRVLPIAASVLIMLGAGYWFFKAEPDKPKYANVIKVNSIQRSPMVKQPNDKPVKGELAQVDLPKGPTRTHLINKKDTVDNRMAIVKKAEKFEDILKKMDALKVDTNGLIVKNGPAVVKIHINGKDFTGGDIKQAVKNLPADALSKIQIIDDYGDQVIKMPPVKITITGKLIDAVTHEPMTGATIGTAGKGLAQADIDGKYKVTVDAGATLVFTNIGYASQAIKLKPGMQSLDVKLLGDSRSRSDPVIRGYVKRNPNDSKGSSYIITGKEVQDHPVGNVEQLLQGKVAGLNIKNNNMVTGRVTDKEGQPIPGVSILNGKKSVATTDVNGQYRVAVNKDSSLAFSSIGYSVQAIKLKPGQATLDIKLDVVKNIALAEVAIVTTKGNPCKENIQFKNTFFGDIAIVDRYVFEHAGGYVTTITDKKFLIALKFIAARAPMSFEANNSAIGYADLKTFTVNKAEWLKWYEANKCNNLK